MQIKHNDRRRKTPRKEAMLARRIRQRSRRAGFTPVTNNRIEARITSTAGILSLAYSQQEGIQMPSAAEIRAEATRAVARTLPAVPIGVRYRRHV